MYQYQSVPFLPGTFYPHSPIHPPPFPYTSAIFYNSYNDFVPFMVVYVQKCKEAILTGILKALQCSCLLVYHLNQLRNLQQKVTAVQYAV